MLSEHNFFVRKVPYINLDLKFDFSFNIKILFRILTCMSEVNLIIQINKWYRHNTLSFSCTQVRLTDARVNFVFFVL